MEHSRLQPKPKTSNVSTTQSSEKVQSGSMMEQNGMLVGQLPITYLQRTIGNRAMGEMLQQGGIRLPLQTKGAPIPNTASGLIQMRKISVNMPEDGYNVTFETKDFTSDFLKRVQKLLDFYDEKAAAELKAALENDEYTDMQEDDDGEYFPLQDLLDHYEKALGPEIEKMKTRIKDKKGPQSLTKFQGNVFEQTTQYDATAEETKAISTNDYHSNFSGVDFMIESPDGPFGQDKSHISGDIDNMVAAYIAEYGNRYENAKKMLSKMLKPKTLTTQNMLKALQAAFDFKGDVPKSVVNKLLEIHENNENVEDTGEGEFITEPDEDLIKLVGDHMLFSCPWDVYEYLPEKIQPFFLASSTTSRQLQLINERSLALGLTKPPKPKGSKDSDPDYDGDE